MQKKTVLVLTVQEAKDTMVEHFTNFLVSNPLHLATLIREGKLDELPNFADVTTLQLSQMLRDNQAGEALAQREGVDVVCVQVADVSLHVVYEKPAAPPVQAKVIQPQEQFAYSHLYPPVG